MPRYGASRNDMNIAEDLKYTKEHEWVRADGTTAYIGITDYAQEHLGEVVFVEPPQMDAHIAKGDVLSVVESFKAASDIYSPLSGQVVKINPALEEEPGLINQDPYENWVAALQIADASEMDDLMDAAAYQAYCENGE